MAARRARVDVGGPRRQLVDRDVPEVALDEVVAQAVRCRLLERRGDRREDVLTSAGLGLRHGGLAFLRRLTGAVRHILVSASEPIHLAPPADPPTGRCLADGTLRGAGRARNRRRQRGRIASILVCGAPQRAWHSRARLGGTVERRLPRGTRCEHPRLTRHTAPRPAAPGTPTRPICPSQGSRSRCARDDARDDAGRPVVDGFASLRPGRAPLGHDVDRAERSVRGIRDPAAGGPRCPQGVDGVEGDLLARREHGDAGRYGATSSALTRPTARSTGRLSRAAKNASRGSRTHTGSTAQTPELTTARAGPRWRSTDSASATPSPSIRGGVSASVTIATTVSRSAISTGIPAPSRSASTALPSAPVPGSTTTSRVGSTAGPSRTTRPGTPANRRRTEATASTTGPSRASPSRSSSALAASMLARMAPDGLVVAVASTAASKRPGRSGGWAPARPPPATRPGAPCGRS